MFVYEFSVILFSYVTDLCYRCTMNTVFKGSVWDLSMNIRCMYSVVVLMCLCTGEQYSAASTEPVSEEALFRDKLKHMGKCKCPDFKYDWCFTKTRSKP